MNKKGGLIVASIITVVAILLAILLITSIRATFTSVSLSSPIDNNWTNDTTPNFIFTATSDFDATFNCTVYVNGTAEGFNNSVVNDTQTTITASPAIAEGVNYQWNVECTDSDETASSGTRKINIDTTPPTASLTSPLPEAIVSNSRPPFTFNCTDNSGENMVYILYDNELSATDFVPNGGATVTFGPVRADGIRVWNVTCTDYVGNSVSSATQNFTINTTDLTPPQVILYGGSFNYMFNPVLFGGGDNISMGGYVDDAESGIQNWSLEIFNSTGGHLGTACTGTNAFNSSETLTPFCYWDTTAFCPIGNVCKNITLMLGAWNNANISYYNHTDENTMIHNIIIDNVYPYINNTAVFAYNPMGMFWNARFKVNDTYLSEVSANVLDNDNYSIIGWNHLCNESQREICNASGSGIYNHSWYTDSYSLNSEVVSVYLKFNLDYYGRSDEWFYLTVPGCAYNSTDYDCGRNYDLMNNPVNPILVPAPPLGPLNPKAYRWWLVYNYSMASGTGTLVGITQENWCNETTGCILNDTLIGTDFTYFIPQIDQYNGANTWTNYNNTNITLYTIGDLNNENLTFNQPAGWYKFLVQARDYVWTSDSLWNNAFYVDNFDPWVTIDNPLDGANLTAATTHNGKVIINITANGTGSPITWGHGFVDNVEYDQRNVTCTYSGPFNELLKCNLTTRVLADGHHTINVSVSDYGVGTAEADNYSSFDLDWHAPSIALYTPSNNNYTNINNVSIKFSPVDGMTTNISCNLTLSPGGTSSIVVVNNSNWTVLETFLSDGAYRWWVNCTDDFGNIGSSTVSTFTVDTSNPVVQNVSATTTDVTATVRIVSNESVIRKVYYMSNSTHTLKSTSWTSTYATTGTVSVSGLSPSTLYLYNVSICDHSGNCVNGTDYNFTTTAQENNAGRIGGGGGGGGTGGNITICGDDICSSTESYTLCPQDCASTQPLIPTTALGDLSTKTGNQSNGTGSENQSFSFIVKGKLHTALIAKISNTSVILWIWSDPIKVIVNLNEPKKIDLDGNGLTELQITLNSVKDGKADLTFKEIPETTTQPTTTTTQPAAKKETNWTLYIIIAAVAIVVILIIVRIAKSKK